MRHSPPGADPDIDRQATAGEEPDVRMSLANERTYLAYTRTALALVVSGLAVAGSARIEGVPRWLAALGVPLIVLGALVAGGAAPRYGAVERAMRAGAPLPPPSVTRYLGWGIAILAVASTVVALVAVVD